DQQICISIIDQAARTRGNFPAKPKFSSGFLSQRLRNDTAHLKHLRGKWGIKMFNFLGTGGENIRLTHLCGEMTVKKKNTALLRTLALNLMRYSNRIPFPIVLGVGNIDDNRWKAFVARCVTVLGGFCKPALGNISRAGECLGHLGLPL